MSTIKKCISFLFLIVILFSCSIEYKPITPTNNIGNSNVSMDDAIDQLNSVLSLIESETKRGNTQRQIASITKITPKDLWGDNTKVDNSATFEQLLYIINFENNEGYAILGADKRIAPVLLIADKGSITKNAFTSIQNKKGNYSVSDYFCEEDNDFYVGTEINNNTNLQIIIDYIIAMSVKPVDPPEGGGGGGGDPTPIIIENSRISPLLSTKWSQNTPFNDSIHFAPGSNQRRPAGCTTIAAAQILAYDKSVSLSNEFNVTSSTWDNLERRFYYWNSIDDNGVQYDSNFINTLNIRKADIASVVKQMADGIGVQYNYLGSGGTFATPASVADYLCDIGYNAQNNIGYSLSTITSMLLFSKPVFIAALESGISGGHAWVIDGMINRTITTGSTSVNQTLLHCNWGWSGECDGYYLSEVFDAVGGLIEYDPSDIQSNDGGADFSSGWWYRIITY